MTNKQTIDRAILILAEHGTLPEISKIEEFTGLSSVTIIRNLDKDYPKELMITELERTVLDAYNSTHTIKDTVKATEMPYFKVTNTLYRLQKKGFIKKAITPREPRDKRTSYIKITDDWFYRVAKGTEINLIGATGYIDDNNFMAEVYLNGKSYKFYAKNCKYKEIGRVSG